MTKFVKDAQGRLRTVDSGPAIDLEKIRRETRDVIQGNVPFHDDPFTPRKQAEVDVELPLQECFCAFLGGECVACRDSETNS